MTLKKIHCQQCSKYLKPVYERKCMLCGHNSWQHPLNAYMAANGSHCTATRDCSCQRAHNADGFIPTVIGYGIFAKNLFCTNRCAVDWAHDHAGITEEYWVGRP